MSGRLCPGCGRLVRGGLTVCLGCGASVEDGVLVTTIAGALRPPAPPVPGALPQLQAAAPAAGLASAAPAGAWIAPAGAWLAPAPQPVLDGRVALVRRLAIAGQAGIAVLYGLSILGRVVLAAAVLGGREPAPALAGVTVAGPVLVGLLVGVLFAAVMCWLFLRRARTASTAWGREDFAWLLRGNLAVLALTCLGLVFARFDPLAFVDVAVVLFATVFAVLAARSLPSPGADWREAR